MSGNVESTSLQYTQPGGSQQDHSYSYSSEGSFRINLQYPESSGITSTNQCLVSSTSAGDEPHESTLNFYCIECSYTYTNQNHCSFHIDPDWIIPDSNVQSRAVLSLPSQFRLAPSSTDLSKLGVWTNVGIYNKTSFEELQGRRIDKDEAAENGEIWKVFDDNQSYSHTIVIGEEQLCNWLMFMRAAVTSREQNVVVGCQEGGVVFKTNQDISANFELLYWFSPGYAKLLGYPSRPEDASCPFCSVRILESVEMVKHKLKTHVIHPKNDRVRGINGKLKGKSWRCNTCHKVFTSSRRLTVHHLTCHFGLKIAICKVCKKTFSDASNLKKHSSIHTGERKFFCEICGQKFRLQAHLKSHSLKHSEDKPLTCKFCVKTFKRKSDLKQHESAVHMKNTKFECLTCKRSFFLLQALIRHSAVHSGRRPYVCHKCSKDFVKKFNLERHMAICRPKPYRKARKSRITEVDCDDC